MKALAIHGKEDIRWEDRPSPEPGDGEVRLRVGYVGICGSDLHYYFHGANGENVDPRTVHPRSRAVGVVDLDPSGRLPARHPGDGAPGALRRAGARASQDRPHLRPGGDYLGSAATFPHRQGGAAELLIVEDHMIRVAARRTAAASGRRWPSRSPSRMHAVNLAGDVSGRRVLVIGAGPIGLLVVAAAADAGAADDRRQRSARRAAGPRAVALGRHRDRRSSAATRSTTSPTTSSSNAPASASRSPRRCAPRAAPAPSCRSACCRTPRSASTSPRCSPRSSPCSAPSASPPRSTTRSHCSPTPTALDAVISHVIPAADAVNAFAVARDASASAKVLLQL